MNDDEIINKFRNNAIPTLKNTQIDMIIEKVGNLEKVKATGELASLLGVTIVK